jgi:Golgi SNAP receptor complex protein 1
MAMPLQSRWEELRKESRRLENEVDQKLVSFSKLGSSYSHRDSSSDPALGGTGHVFDTLALEIEQLLGKLRRVNSSMNEYVSNLNSSTPTTTLYHTLQRHNEILQDYGQEFNRTKSNILAQRQREELLGSSRKEGYKGSALNRRTELYLKEHEHIQSSDKLTDEAIRYRCSIVNCCVIVVCVFVQYCHINQRKPLAAEGHVYWDDQPSRSHDYSISSDQQSCSEDKPS